MNGHAITQSILPSSQLKFSIVLLIIIYSCHSGFSQSVDISQLDTFSVDRHSGEEFAAAIRTVRKSIIKSEEFQRIEEVDEYVDILSQFYVQQ